MNWPFLSAPAPQADALAAELHAAGHLRAAAWPVAAADTPVSRWIAGLQIIGGWLAAVFLLGFFSIGLAPLIQGAAGWIAIGLLMSAGVAWPLRSAHDTVWRQFLLVVALAGHGALIVGAVMMQADHDSGLPYFVLALYEAALLAWVAWMPHRLVAALIAGAALAAALTVTFGDDQHSFMLVAGWWAALYWLAAGLLWLGEPRWQAQRQADAIAALACALALLSLGCALFELPDVLGRAALPRFDRGLLAAVNAVLIALLARAVPRDARHLAAVALLLAALGLTWTAPAVGMGGVALALGFARGRPWLMWLGGAVLVYGVSRFYYDLHLSLLLKSGLMVLGGALLLAVRALLGSGETA